MNEQIRGPHMSPEYMKKAFRVIEPEKISSDPAVEDLEHPPQEEDSRPNVFSSGDASTASGVINNSEK